MNCEHRRIKKNYPFGRKSSPTMFCLDCDEVVSLHDRMLERKKRKEERKRYRGMRDWR